LPSFADYKANMDAMIKRSRKLGGGFIWVDKKGDSGLLEKLEMRTSLACSLCEKEYLQTNRNSNSGGRGKNGSGRYKNRITTATAAATVQYKNKQHLQRHLRQQHGACLCELCLEKGHSFPLELPTYKLATNDLKEHYKHRHPRCDFCMEHFYGDDTLYTHMQQKHYSCHVCAPTTAGAAQHAYFNTAVDLSIHMRDAHFVCDEPECADCFVAFTTIEELKRHHIQQHSTRMPRWDASRARPLPLDYSFTQQQQQQHDRRSTTRSRNTAEHMNGNGSVVRFMNGRRQRRQQQGSSGTGMGMSNNNQSNRMSADIYGNNDNNNNNNNSGSYTMIDDDLGMLYPDDVDNRSRSSFASAAASARRSSGTLRGPEDFPSLSAVAAALPRSSSAAASDVAAGGVGMRSSFIQSSTQQNQQQQQQSSASRPPPLIKLSIKCPCGRRTSHFVVEEGQEPPQLACDAICQVERRKLALADAFGIPESDRNSGLSSFDRNRRRVASYNGALLYATKTHPKLIEGFEKDLHDFVTDPSQPKRHVLGAMSKEHRQLLHQLAEHGYGLATQSVGQDPRRSVELFRTHSTALPTRLLSRVAPTVSDEEIVALIQEAGGHSMRFTDVAPTTDIKYFLRRWDGGFRCEWEAGGDGVVVRFDRETDRDEALNALGGGIRGVFLIDRAYRPKVAVQTPSGSVVVDEIGVSGGGGGSGGSSWTAVARNNDSATSAGGGNSKGEEVSQMKQGWQVIGSSKMGGKVARMNGAGEVRK
jgi:E3 ubiquitin-protein ligase ZNF598